MYNEEWPSIGERLGLTGADLLAFYNRKEQWCVTREERAQIRDEERRQMEMDFELRMKEKE